jgi:hypothetical protein
MIVVVAMLIENGRSVTVLRGGASIADPKGASRPRESEEQESRRLCRATPPEVRVKYHFSTMRPSTRLRTSPILCT